MCPRWYSTPLWSHGVVIVEPCFECEHHVISATGFGGATRRGAEQPLAQSIHLVWVCSNIVWVCSNIVWVCLGTLVLVVGGGCCTLMQLAPSHTVYTRQHIEEMYRCETAGKESAVASMHVQICLGGGGELTSKITFFIRNWKSEHLFLKKSPAALRGGASRPTPHIIPPKSPLTDSTHPAYPYPRT